MRTRISSERISELWQSEHPRAKQPPIRAYHTSKAEITQIKNDAIKGQHGYGKGNEGHGKNFNSDNPSALHITGSKYDTILVQRRLEPRFEKKVLKHELNHAYEQRHAKNR